MIPVTPLGCTSRAPRSHTFAPALVLALALMLFLPTAPAYGLPAATSTQRDYDIAFDITLNTDDTYNLTMAFVDRSKTPRFTAESCNAQTMLAGRGTLAEGKAEFTEADGERTCTITGSESIANTNGLITHTDGEYVVDTKDLPDSKEVQMTLRITFPGEITQADGGEVSGNTVTFDSLGGHKVRGKDAPQTLPRLWISLGAAAAAVIVAGGIAGVFLLRKKRQQAGFEPEATLLDHPQAPPAL